MGESSIFPQFHGIVEDFPTMFDYRILQEGTTQAVMIFYYPSTFFLYILEVLFRVDIIVPSGKLTLL